MEEKSNGITKKSVLLALGAIAIIAVAIILAVAIARSNNNQLDVPKNSLSSSTQSAVKSESESGSTQRPGDDQNNSQSSTPTVSQIVFLMPVLNGEVITEYTASGVVYNQTLGIYTGHMGIDIQGENNAEVLCAYDGVISEITTTYLKGTTIVVDHGNSLYTVYNSVEPLENLSVGDLARKGDVLGYVSANNLQEYKDGAHLHFEVMENGENIDPGKYLSITGK